MYAIRSYYAGWELLGGEALADSLDAVVEAGSERGFWEAFLPLLPSGRLLRLPNLVEGTPTLSILSELCGRLGLSCRVEESDRSPRLPLPDDFVITSYSIHYTKLYDTRKIKMRSFE